MADDGMLMNFDLGDGVIKSAQPKFKGGTWKNRLSAKKIAVQRHQGPKLPLSSENPKGHDQKQWDPNRIRISRDHQFVKRRKVDNPKDEADFRPTSIATDAVTHSERLRDQKEGKARNYRAEQTEQTEAHEQPQNKEVISSLFTYNPAAKTTDETAKTEDDAQGEEITAQPSNAPLIEGLDTFTSFGLSPTLAAHLLTKMHLKSPTSIQKNSITQLLKEQSDAFIQAETGSGKTLAYLLPIVQQLMNLSNGGKDKNDAVHRDSGLFAIILAPTRELCKQISVVLDALLNCAHWIVSGTVIGGEKKKSEKARLRKGLNILVATPGRLADHLDNTSALDVGNVRWLVLDEGDRLMDLGFDQEIQGIVKKLDERQRPSKNLKLPQKRMTMLCSATLKMNVQRLGEISLKDAVHIQGDPDEASDKKGDDEKQEAFLAPVQLKQTYAIVAAKLRLVALTALMKRAFARKGSVMKAIIFVSCADSVDFYYELFTRLQRKPGQTNFSPDSDGDSELDTTKDKDSSDKPATNGNQEQRRPSKSTRDPSIIANTVAEATAFSNPTNKVILHRLHGSLPQQARTATLNSFARQERASVLICTDVAARGLDLPNVDYVVEYDPAYSAEDHLHRIGRTARLGRDGRAMVFLLPGPEEGYAEVLRNGYRDGGKKVTRVDVNEIMKRGFGGNTDATSKDWAEKATDWQLDVERWALGNPHILDMAKRAYQSHIRAYATHLSEERKYFNIKELHLGHLAKSFALRDRPSKINVPGLRK